MVTHMTRPSTFKGFLIGCIFAVAVPALAATFNLFSPATGVLKGSASTYVTTAAVSSDIIAMWTGTCTASTTRYLATDGTCQVVAAGGSVANPTAVIGLTAVNGAATSAIRSDGAPALSQAIVPTWTGAHTFAATMTARNILPQSATTYDIGADGNTYNKLFVESVLEANGWPFLSFTGTTLELGHSGWTGIDFGNSFNSTYFYIFEGAAGSATFKGSIVGQSATGGAMGAGTANVVGSYVNGISASAITSGAVFTATGCSITSLVGGDTAGTFNSGTSGTCTVAITLPIAHAGWVCAAQDLTTPATFQQTATTTTSCTVAATTVSGDAVVFTARSY